MKQRHVKKIALIILIPLLVLFVSYKEMTGSNGNKSIVWQTDKAPIEKRIPLLVPFETCIWHRGKLYNWGRMELPAPEEYFIRGFLKISDESTKRLLKNFKWSPAKYDISTIKKPATASIVDEFLSSKELLESDEFQQEHTRKSSFCDGHLILNPKSHVVYFDLSNM